MIILNYMVMGKESKDRIVCALVDNAIQLGNLIPVYKFSLKRFFVGWCLFENSTHMRPCLHLLLHFEWLNDSWKIIMFIFLN